MSEFSRSNATYYRNGLSYNAQYPRDNYGRGYPEQYQRPNRPAQRQSNYDRDSSRRKRKGGSGLGIVFRIIIIILFIAVLMIEPLRDQFFMYLQAGLDHYNEIPESSEFILERRMAIETDQPIDYTLYLPLPEDVEIKDVLVQEVVNLESTPNYRRGEGDFRDRMMWEGTLRSGGSQEIVVKYHMKATSIIWDNIGYNSVGTISDIPNRIQYGYDKQPFLDDVWPVKDYNDSPGVDSDGDGIEDERDVDDDNNGIPDKYRIEPSNQEINDLLDDILNWADVSSSGVSSDLNVWEVTDAIYRYLRTSSNKVKYPTPEEAQADNYAYGGNPKWATACFDDRRGDCDDQSILFISLCRAAGIPAWLEIGALYNFWTHEWEGHGWANFYVPMKNGGYEVPMVDVVNSLFLVRDTNRFSEWMDDGVRGHFGADGDPNAWEGSNLEKHYIAWQYTYTGSPPQISTEEDYKDLFFEAHPSEKVYY